MTDERLLDLVRYARSYLHTDELITDEEYDELCASDGRERIARLRTYDQMRKEIEQLRKRVNDLERSTGAVCTQMGKDFRSHPYTCADCRDEILVGHVLCPNCQRDRIRETNQE